MKRISYISQSKPDFTENDLKNILESATRINKKYEITGLLIYMEKMFFQILEGDFESVDLIMNNIKKDHRHYNVRILTCEEVITERHYPDWSMKLLIIDKYTNLLIMPIKSLLFSLEKTGDLLIKFSQSNIINLLESGLDPLRTKPRKCEKIILFCNIIGFNNLAKSLGTDEFSYLVNKYFNIISSEIEEHSETVNRFLGDSLQCYFGDSDSDSAITCALSLLRKFKDLREIKENNIIEKNIHIVIGIAKGPVLEGIFTFGKKAEYTITGEVVKLAEKLVHFNKKSLHCLLLSKKIKESSLKNWTFIGIEDKIFFPYKNIFSIKNDLTEIYSKEKIIKELTAENIELDKKK